MEFGRPRPSEKLVPCIRSDCRDTREPSLDTTEINRSKNPGEIGAERAYGCVAFAIRLNTNNQEYRRAGEWRQNRLRYRCWIFSVGCAHTNTVDFASDRYTTALPRGWW